MRLSQQQPTSALINTERRSQHRYPVELDVQCKPPGSKAIHVGKTTDMSGGGVRFHIDDELPVGALIELSIKWPQVSSSADCALELFVEGSVVRSDRNEAAIRILRYSFGNRAMIAKRPISEHPDILVA